MLSIEQVERVRQLRSEGLSFREVGRIVGCGKNVVRRYCQLDLLKAAVHDRAAVHVHRSGSRRVLVERADGTTEATNSAKVFSALLVQEGLRPQYAIEVAIAKCINCTKRFRHRIDKPRALCGSCRAEPLEEEDAEVHWENCIDCGSPFVKNTRPSARHCEDCYAKPICCDACPRPIVRNRRSGYARLLASRPKPWLCNVCQRHPDGIQRQPTRAQFQPRRSKPIKSCEWPGCGAVVKKRFCPGHARDFGRMVMQDPEKRRLAAEAGRRAMQDPVLRQKAINGCRG